MAITGHASFLLVVRSDRSAGTCLGSEIRNVHGILPRIVYVWGGLGRVIVPDHRSNPPTRPPDPAPPRTHPPSPGSNHPRQQQEGTGARSSGMAGAAQASGR